CLPPSSHHHTRPRRSGTRVAVPKFSRRGRRRLVDIEELLEEVAPAALATAALLVMPLIAPLKYVVIIPAALGGDDLIQLAAVEEDVGAVGAAVDDHAAPPQGHHVAGTLGAVKGSVHCYSPSSDELSARRGVTAGRT